MQATHFVLNAPLILKIFYNHVIPILYIYTQQNTLLDDQAHQQKIINSHNDSGYKLWLCIECRNTYIEGRALC